MTAEELYNFLVEHLTPEEALKNLLKGSVMQYENLKFDKKGVAVHPLLLIIMAAKEMGWQIAVENCDGDEEVKGIAVGTEEYLNSILDN